MSPNVTRVGRTEHGWLAVEVDFGEHQNDFLFPDTDDAETIKRVIRNWYATHEIQGDQRSHLTLDEMLDHELMNCEL